MPKGVTSSASFVTVFLGSSPGGVPEPLPSIEKLLRIMGTAPGDKVEKQLNVSTNAESFAPVFHLGAGIDTAVAFQHFHFRLFGVRRFQTDD